MNAIKAKTHLGRIDLMIIKILMNINSKKCYILGISCFYHSAAAALLKDGELIATAEEERFSRIKHDSSFPVQSIGYCLKQANINIRDISIVVFYEKPLLKLERILVSFISTWPFEFKNFASSMKTWLAEKLWTRSLIKQKLNFEGPIYFLEHHMSHASSVFFVSPFKRAAILTADGAGEWATATFGVGIDNHIQLLAEMRYPNSIGLLYSAITYFLGFKPNSDEQKIMGLAPYGKPIFRNKINKLVTLREDGSLVLGRALRKSNYAEKKVAKELEAVFGFSVRAHDEPLEARHKDLAASIQDFTNEAMLKMAQHVRLMTKEENLCLAGGMALNCVSNEEIFQKAGFKKIFIQPAAGDAGGALGAAYFVWHEILKKTRSYVMEHAFYGPEFSDEEIKEFLDSKSIKYAHLETPELLSAVAKFIDEQKIVGWFQGRMEWGPRALGHRSILADPRNKDNWERVNLKIKFRESFRPFAPAVIREDAAKYFAPPGADSPFMMYSSKVLSVDIPAVTHIDNSARPQTVNKKDNELFYGLLESFKKLTDCSVIINTSFNTRDEPIVCTPKDAWKTFQETDMDILVMGGYIISNKYPVK